MAAKCERDGCGEDLPPPGKRGPRRRYCSSTCRVQAKRMRDAPVGLVAYPGELSNVVAMPPQRVAVPRIPPGDPAERLLSTLFDLQGAVGELRQIAVVLPAAVRWRAAELAELIEAGVDRLFPVEDGAGAESR